MPHNDLVAIQQDLPILPPIACPYCGTIDLKPIRPSMFCAACRWHGHLYRMLTADELAVSAKRSAGSGYHKVAQRKRQILATLQP